MIQTLLPSILVPQGIDLASQHLRGERAEDLGWEPQLVVLGEGAERGHRISWHSYRLVFAFRQILGCLLPDRVVRNYSL